MVLLAVIAGWEAKFFLLLLLLVVKIVGFKNFELHLSLLANERGTTFLQYFVRSEAMYHYDHWRLALFSNTQLHGQFTRDVPYHERPCRTDDD